MNKKNILLIVSFIIFLNLGNILDSTEESTPADVIVVLGGGADSRIKKGIELYLKGNSISKRIIYTGGNFYSNSEITLDKYKLLLLNNIRKENIVNIKGVKNTMDELIEVKKYVIKNNMKSILLVTHPSHTLRVKLLANIIADYNEDHIKIIYISADHTKAWNKYLYFFNIKSTILVFGEYIKIIYNLIKYF
jgi:uncharacterized SAM-binding protein YcdF (DUF218 family)